jgi:signal transduction histidine kinase
MTLHEFLTSNRAEIIARTRAKVALRSSPPPSERELETGVPLFLDQLISVLRTASPSQQDLQSIGEGAAIHGGQLLRGGFTVSQVVHGYGDVCQAVTDLAVETNAPITTEEFRVLNRSLDDAIAEAVTEFMRLRDQALAVKGNVRSGELAHELRNKLSAASMAFELLKKGTVALGGSVSALITRNLAQMSTLIQRSLMEVRLGASIKYRERVPVADLIDEAEVDGAIEASSRGRALTVTPSHDGGDVEVDRQIVAGAVANLLQNAFKFTRPDGVVTLRTSSTEARVMIEVEDQCGGLPPGRAEELFEAFKQRGDDRSGLGLGLFISRKGIEANGGVIRVQNLPGCGCIFTIDLPRANAPVPSHGRSLV